MRNHDKQIFLMASGLPRGATKNDDECPSCGIRGSFSITNNGQGILYNCFRNKCGIKGFIPFSGTSFSNGTKEPKTKEYKPIDTINLNENQLQFFLDKFGLDVSKHGFKWAPDYNRVYIPVIDWYGREIGVCLRGYKELHEYEGPKTLNFKFSHTVPFAYYSFGCYHQSSIILVEDIISCLKISEAVPGIGVVALLGTNISQDMIKVIGKRKVLCWLDGDAFSKSIQYQKSLSLFLDIEVIYTEKDPKDLDIEEIKHVLNGKENT